MLDFLNVCSEVGKGTTFRVYFPSSTGARGQLQPDLRGDLLTGNETILVAEDHEGTRAVANEILSSHGYKTILAADGLEACDSSDKTRQGLILRFWTSRCQV
jgi:PleD family two-component response regulator